MTPPTVAFYVHHDGAGHASRTAAIAAELPGPVTAASSLDLLARVGFDGIDTVLLPDDVPTDPLGDVTANGAFHWVPECPPVATPRMRAILDWLDRRSPDVVVVDVSVEVACLVRLAGVPVVGVRMHGERRDAAHLLGYRLADHLIAPFAAALEDPSVPGDVRAKTTYCGAIGVGAAPTEPPTRHLRPRVVVVWGRGTPPPPGPVLDDAALATPDWDWEFLGPPTPVRPPTITRHLGWVDDVDAVVRDADVLVGPPGNGVVALVARTGVPFVALPRDRPFDEQHAHADRLEAAGIALVARTWPPAGDWSSILDAARELDRGRVAALHHDGAARRAADAIVAVAEARRPLAVT